MTLDAYLTREKESGLTETDFAARVGMTQSSVNRLRKGLTRPTAETQAAIARATDGEVMPNDWFDGLPVAA